MKTTKILIASFSAALLMWSCNVNDPIYDTAHPDKGKITLTADWGGLGTGVAKPSGYDISVAGYTCRLSGDINTIDNLFVPGTYTGLAWNTPEKITISGSMATVAVTAAHINAMPGWLITARDNNVVVEKDQHHQYTAIMQQQVRQLTLTLNPEGGTADKIESITATLSGVAGSLDIANDTHGSSSDVALTFTRITSGANAGKWSATVRLLGVTGAQQKLSGTIKFTAGTPGDTPLESDLTADMVNFNADKKTPLVLGGTIESPTEAGFSATINDWVNGGNNGGIAN